MNSSDESSHFLWTNINKLFVFTGLLSPITQYRLHCPWPLLWLRGTEVSVDKSSQPWLLQTPVTPFTKIGTATENCWLLVIQEVNQLTILLQSLTVDWFLPSDPLDSGTTLWKHLHDSDTFLVSCGLRFLNGWPPFQRYYWCLLCYKLGCVRCWCCDPSTQ